MSESDVLMRVGRGSLEKEVPAQVSSSLCKRSSKLP
ncbi:hypothetical protein AVEN_51264-1, partial [Araneus ventricosus]